MEILAFLLYWADIKPTGNFRFQQQGFGRLTQEFHKYRWPNPIHKYGTK